MDLVKEFIMLLTEFTKQESAEFKYWSIFQETLVPVLRDLIHSFREKACCPHLSAVKGLFFSFGRKNYSRWKPSCSDDFFKLEEKFLMLCKKLMEGDFCVQLPTRASRSVPMVEQRLHCF